MSSQTILSKEALKLLHQVSTSRSKRIDILKIHGKMLRIEIDAQSPYPTSDDGENGNWRAYLNELIDGGYVKGSWSDGFRIIIERE